MPQPVVHFEVIGRDPARLRSYFGEMFSWEFDVHSPVAQEVSESENYGFMNTVTAEDGTGIPGGVGGGSGYESHATSVCLMLKLRCSGRKNAEEPGPWVQLRHQMDLSSDISKTPKVHCWALLERHSANRYPPSTRRSGIADLGESKGWARPLLL
jgi:hypothetical protein